MKHPSQMSRTAKLVEGALMMALAFVLSLLPHYQLPFGGSITFFSTLPILLMSLRHGARWGVGTALAYSLLQTLQGMPSIMLCKTIPTMALCALLDYLLAYSLLGLAGPIAGRFHNAALGLIGGVVSTGLLRLLCSFLSGILLWREYATPGMPVWYYSLTYNAAWCLPDTTIALFAILLLSRIPAMGVCKNPSGVACE